MKPSDTLHRIAPGAAKLPRRWNAGLYAAWQKKQGGGNLMEKAHAGAWVIGMVDSLGGVRIPLDATDSDICGAADTLAAKCWEVAALYKTTDLQRAALARIATAQGVPPPGKDDSPDGPAIARMLDPLWWRRQLRRMHAKKVEGAAISLGYVNRARDRYVSDESVFRRAQQNARNAATLEATEATNEHGHTFTLAELAAKGPANKAIRRAELMTRIAGFERIADDLGHVGIFATLSCPSRMHKFTTANGGLFENRRYDGTLPNQAQKYLGKVWARTRSALHRAGVGVYGFRIAEPQHDGTPHWHLLLFVQPHQADTLRELFHRQALKDNGTEPGALLHRLDWKAIDKSKGSAAGYIAKYVAKNIDGHSLTTDLCGGVELVADSVDTAHRVETWAATWGIRQFQQVGGPPVGPWRELRRVQAVPATAPQFMQDAHRAANKLTDLEAGTVKSVSWAHYVDAQGGVFCGRDYRVRVAMIDPDGLGKYGEPLADRPVGIEAETTEIYTPAHMAWMGGKAERVLHWFIESVRHVWTIARRAAGRVLDVQKHREAGPWTSVNNCTENLKNGPSNSGKTAGIRSTWPEFHEPGGSNQGFGPAFG